MSISNIMTPNTFDLYCRDFDCNKINTTENTAKGLRLYGLKEDNSVYYIGIENVALKWNYTGVCTMFYDSVSNSVTLQESTKEIQFRIQSTAAGTVAPGAVPPVGDIELINYFPEIRAKVGTSTDSVTYNAYITYALGGVLNGFGRMYLVRPQNTPIGDNTMKIHIRPMTDDDFFEIAKQFSFTTFTFDYIVQG